MGDDNSYLTLSEELNALDYLEKTVSFLVGVESNPVDWKWVILALHGAIYGFMICALKGTDQYGVLQKTKRTTRLIDFREALARCQDTTWMNMTCHSQMLKLSDDQKRALDYIHQEFRNRFIHYQPCLWSIELRGLPQIISHALDVVQFLSLETGNYTHLTSDQRARIKDLVDGAKVPLHKRECQKT